MFKDAIRDGRLVGGQQGKWGTAPRVPAFSPVPGGAGSELCSALLGSTGLPSVLVMGIGLHVGDGHGFALRIGDRHRSALHVGDGHGSLRW